MESSGNVLEIRNLRKRFGRTAVLKKVDLTLPRGAIYGFVGPNGAGKTTTLECALGLLGFHGGEITLFGSPPGRIAATGGRVGAVFDTAAAPPHLTVRQTLEHARTACGRIGRSPAEVETLLTLERWRRAKTRHLSLGNRRRLSIAVALLGRPEALILDEPFSGLDAGGVDDLLSLLGRLNREEGLTVLISSHHLHYVERISSHVGLIQDGTTTVEDRLDALLEADGARLRLRVDDTVRALELLRNVEGVRSAMCIGAGSLELELDGTDPAHINAHLVKKGLAVSELVSERSSLAAYFRQSLGGQV